MKVNGEGQAAILTTEQIDKILNGCNPQQRLFFQVLRYTGERPKTVCKLQRKNCYHDDDSVREYLTFPGSSRKQSGGQKAKERLVFLVPQLKHELKKYPRTLEKYLFPSPKHLGSAISYFTARGWLEKILKAVGLTSYGITLYSFRRTFITNLARQGLTLADLKAATGHASTTSVVRYIESDPYAVQRAMMNLD